MTRAQFEKRVAELQPLAKRILASQDSTALRTTVLQGAADQLAINSTWPGMPGEQVEAQAKMVATLLAMIEELGGKP